ncbi:DOMON-like domain-containing protein [Qipengyuania sp.]|uniref:DOMON-like domain-containing protein n=1 Tax=Qipengyuania sp. TaxID=2004515 RepID=UPI0035C8220D
MKTLELTAHPARPPSRISGITARVVSLDGEWLRLRWRIEGAQALVAPPFAGRGRDDGLWRTTCFELFVRDGEGPGYAEFNLSPSERWNAYRFADYREGQEELPLPREPDCTLRQGSSFAIFDAAIPAIPLFGGEPAIALSAVIEEEGAALSYWALAHPGADPDFHAPACFAATLEPPKRA